MQRHCRICRELFNTETPYRGFFRDVWHLITAHPLWSLDPPVSPMPQERPAGISEKQLASEVRDKKIAEHDHRPGERRPVRQRSDAGIEGVEKEKQKGQQVTNERSG